MKRYIYKRHFPHCAIFAAICGLSLTASAATVTNIAIVSAPETLTAGTCSASVRLRAENSSGASANVPANTQIYFYGSSSSLHFFTDSLCTVSAANGVTMQQGTHAVSVYFTASTPGTELIAASTSLYGSAQQSESITSAPVPPQAPPPVSGQPRAIPAPLYGVTLDDVSNVSEEVTSLGQLVHMPTARVVFDYSEPPSYYAAPIQSLRNVSYVMGQIADSSDMKKFTTASYLSRAQNYVASLANIVDLWEIGNEVNGNWLGTGMMPKVEAAYDTVSAAGGSTAITFFYEGEPSDQNNCISTANGGNDMFTWINTNFQLNLAASQRSAETEKIRLGTNYILISWYPQQCNNLQPNWSSIFSKLATIFPNSRLGFGELGTANPQGGSSYEVNLINQFYPMAKSTSLPPAYVGGYFWWYYAEEMVPSNATILFNTLNQAIQ